MNNGNENAIGTNTTQMSSSSKYDTPQMKNAIGNNKPQKNAISTNTQQMSSSSKYKYPSDKKEIP